MKRWGPQGPSGGQRQTQRRGPAWLCGGRCLASHSVPGDRPGGRGHRERVPEGQGRTQGSPAVGGATCQAPGQAWWAALSGSDCHCHSQECLVRPVSDTVAQTLGRGKAASSAVVRGLAEAPDQPDLCPPCPKHAASCSPSPQPAGRSPPLLPCCPGRGPSSCLLPAPCLHPCPCPRLSLG